MAAEVPTIAETAIQFGQELPESDRLRQQAEVSRFVRWLGPSRPIDQVTVVDVETYQDEVLRSGADPNLRLAPVREMLTFAKKRGYISGNLAKYIKIKRSSGKRTGGVETKVETEVLHVTPEGYADLKKEYEYLTTVKRDEIARELYEARIDKDFRENAPYDAAKQHQAEVEARIRQLERILATAQIVSQTASGTKVTLGATVILRDLTHDEELTYTLVGSTEANPAAGRISTSSPVGRAVIDRHVGDEVTVSAPMGTIVYRIERIQS